MARQRQISVKELRAHPQNKRIYADGSVDDLVVSIREVGILEPLVINDRKVVISGHRRLQAAKKIKLKTVPVRVESFADETVALIQFNRQRLKTWSDRYREIQIVLPKLKDAAAERKRQGARRGAAVRHGLPQANIGSSQSRRTLDDVAEWTGLSREKVRKLIRIFDAVDEGLLEPISICEDGTIISGHRRVKAAKALGMKSVPVRVITTNDRTCAFRFGGKGTC